MEERMRIRQFISSCIFIAFLSQCSEPVESIVLENDTQFTVEITFNNITIASTEELSIQPGKTGNISLKGIRSTDSIEKIDNLLKEYVVIRFFRIQSMKSELRGDQAIKRLSGNLRRENGSWVVRMSDIFKG